MAEKLLKKKAHKVSPKKKPEEQAKKTVLVGTYKGDQLEKWPGYYNYPISSKDKIDVESAKKVNELWLFQGAKAGRYFSAEYVGTFTRDELKTQFGYPAKGKPHGDKYLLYKITKTDIYDPATGLAEAVIVRAKDFKTASRTGRQIKAYLESPERKDPVTANLVPKILTELPREVLRVCEVAVQMDFLRDIDMLQTEGIVNKDSFDNRLSQNDARLTCLDFFAGSGLVSAGLSSDFRTVWANDISQKKALVFNANNQAGVLQVCPIENISGRALPAVDLSWGSFPCQDLSLAGDIKGLYASRSGLFWQWLRVMDEMPDRPPVVVAENVVGLVSAAEGKYYIAVHDELVKRGYCVGAVMLDAANWLPQSRKRIFVIGVKKGVDIRELSSSSATWCHPEPIVKVSRKVADWVWWKIPRPVCKKPVLDEIVDFDSPCDSASSQLHKLSLVAKEKIDMLKELSRGCRRAFTGYRRTRNHKQVLEVRTDGMAGCLRTPCGGSSRQILIIADDGKLRTRLLTVRETARLMGVPDSYIIPGSYNDGYMAMGDAVAVPVVEYLSSQLLAPLSKAVKVKG